MSNYEDRILFCEFVSNEEDIKERCSDTGVFVGIDKVLAAADMLLSDNLPAMDVYLVFADINDEVHLFANMNLDSDSEDLNKYKTHYKCNISVEKFKEFDEKSLEDIFIQVCGRYCDDLINHRWDRVIEFSKDNKEKHKDMPNR